MQKVKQYAPWIAAVAGSGAIANAGYVLNAALNMDSSNIVVLLQALVSLLLGLGGVGYAAKSSGGAVVSSTFSGDMEAVKHLAESLNEYEDASEPLRAISDIALQKEMEPGD